jgi:hypothetical protein
VVDSPEEEEADSQEEVAQSTDSKVVEASDLCLEVVESAALPAIKW